ncbi:MAG TPA: thermonuclease family protein [Ilumatobacter sp.]|nr:thermonuclease family protein [Ilumatobacter sp.]
MRGTRILIGATLLLTSGACRGATSAGPTTTPATSATASAVTANATVEWVVDGDTIDVVIDGRTERVRLIGIDTPEVAHTGTPERPGNPAECFGDAASAFTGRLLPEGTPVRLERDVVARDDYGRLLAYVYRADDGVFVNYELARQGYAQPMTFPPNTAHAERFVDAARLAEADDAGLWAACR